MKRFISVLLVSVMLLSLMTACASEDPGKNNEKVPSDTTAPTADTTVPLKEYVKDELPELDFDGKKITVLTHETTLTADELTVEELTSEVVNDSVYNRERFVEDRLGVEIENYRVDPQKGDYETLVTIQHESDDDSYQLLAYCTGPFTRFVFDGYFCDLNTVDYIDLSKPWYSQQFIDKAEIFDSLYLVTGSLSLTLSRLMYVTYYNKTLAEKYSAGIPELSDVNAIVDSGEWTIDKYRELGSEVYEDANGNSKYDDEDIYGMSFTGGQVCDIPFSTFDIDILSRTDDGWFELNVDTERMYTAYDKLYTLMYETPTCINGTLDVNTIDVFPSGQLLFMIERLTYAESPAFRNMTDDYGILPTPKLDTDQKNYYTYSYDEYTSFAIPRTNPDPDCAGAVLEALSSYAYRDTMPAYLDTALKGKYMSDPQSRKMIDLAVEGLKLDTAWIYIESIGSNFPRAFSGSISGGDESFASTYTSKERGVKRDLLGYRAVFEKNN